MLLCGTEDITFVEGVSENCTGAAGRIQYRRLVTSESCLEDPVVAEKAMVLSSKLAVLHR